MKKLLFILAAATLVACSEKVSLNETREIPIDFTKAFIENSTKAIATGPYTTDNFSVANNTMGVYGWKNVTSNNTTSDSPIFENQLVKHDGNNWDYTSKKYWDSNANHYKFFAYAPNSGDLPSGTAVSMANSTATSFSIAGFTQSTTVANQIDLLVDLTSQANCTINKHTTKERVGFTFGHILSLVNIKMGVSATLKADNTANPVTIQSVSLNGVYINGTYSYSSSAWQWSSRTSTNNFSATPSTDAFFTSDHLTATAENVPGLANMLLIPGSVSNYTIKINYTIGTEPFERTINLTDFKNGNAAAGSDWAINGQYNYVLTIGPDPIEFTTTSVGSWADGVTYTYEVK